MFRICTHKDVVTSLEAIGAAFAIFESQREKPGGAVLVSANSLFEEVTARPVLECIGLSLAEFLPRYVEKQMRSCFALCLEQQSSQEAELIVERKGSSRWWRILASPIRSAVTEKLRMIVTLVEITEKKILEQKLEVARQRFKAVVDSAYDGIITIDQQQTIKLMNPAAREIFGVPDGVVVEGGDLSKFIPPRFRDEHPHYVDGFRQSAVDVRPMQSRPPVCGLRSDGSEFPVEVTLSKIRVGNDMEMTAFVRDITERTKLLEQLKKAATHDSLTGIFNRRHGANVLGSEIHRSQRFSHELTLVMLDIDHFKVVNDNYGHACGDLVLISVVAAISRTLRDSDTFCRWGGEEFLVILPETSLDDALHWAERARAVVAAEKIVGADGQAITVTVSLGLAAIGENDSLPEELIKRADQALYRAKEQGRNRVMALLPEAVS